MTRGRLLRKMIKEAEKTCFVNDNPTLRESEEERKAFFGKLHDIAVELGYSQEHAYTVAESLNT